MESTNARRSAGGWEAPKVKPELRRLALLLLVALCVPAASACLDRKVADVPLDSPEVFFNADMVESINAVEDAEKAKYGRAVHQQGDPRPGESCSSSTPPRRHPPPPSSASTL